MRYVFIMGAILEYHVTCFSFCKAEKVKIFIFADRALDKHRGLYERSFTITKSLKGVKEMIETNTNMTSNGLIKVM